MGQQYVIHRAPQNDIELWWAVRAAWGITIPRVAVCEGHCAPFDAFAEAYFARTPIGIWKACIPAGTPVSTEYGPVPIEHVAPGTRVWSGEDGQTLETVTDNWSVGIRPALRIRTRAGELVCTDNHVVLVQRECGWRKYRPVWVRADEIYPGDMLVRPKQRDAGIDPGREICEIAGLLLADGHVEKYKFLIAHHREAAYMPHYEKAVASVFGKEMRSDPENRCSWLHSKEAADICQDLGLGGTARTKRVPSWVFMLSRERKIDFLRGFLDGDGTVRKDGVEFYSCNRWLLEDIRHLAMACGLRTGRNRFVPMAGSVVVNGRMVHRGDMYVVRVYDLAEIGSNDPKYTFREVRPQRSVCSGDGWTGHRVLSVERGEDSEVFDLTVSGTESFVADGYVVHNSRGFGGKTQLLSILGMSELAFLGAFVTILGGSGEQSRRVHETMSEAWHYRGAPKHLLIRDPTKNDTYLSNGGKARTLMASSRSVRGPHPQRLRMDEIDEMELAILTAAQGQPMRKKNQRGELLETNTVFSSTHQYPDGTMTYMLREAVEKDWSIRQWCYKECSNPEDGWLRMEEVERKRSEVPAAMFAAEYDLQEPNFQGRAIDEESVERMFDPQWAVVDGKEGYYYQFISPCPDRDYVTGVDWAKQRDFTVIATWDATVLPWKLAAFEKINRRPWPMMVGRLNKRWAMYGGVVVSDSLGIGNVVNDYIEFPPGSRRQDLVEYSMAGKIRSEMVTEVVQGVENRDFLAPRIKSVYDDFRFVTPEDLYNIGSTAHLPDTIAATALAWTARKREQRRDTQVVSLTRDASPWKI